MSVINFIVYLSVSLDILFWVDGGLSPDLPTQGGEGTRISWEDPWGASDVILSPLAPLHNRKQREVWQLRGNDPCTQGEITENWQLCMLH